MKEANNIHLIPRVCYKLQMMGALSQSPMEHFQWRIKLINDLIMSQIQFKRIQ